jgi:uroporphyrinogen-III synthase
VAGDLAGRLGAAGFALRRVVLYEAQPAAELGSATRDALRLGHLDLALFFSPRTAATFVNLTAAAGLGAACGRITAIALSPAVASGLEALAWRGVRSAGAPTQSALLTELDAILAEGALQKMVGVERERSV